MKLSIRLATFFLIFYAAALSAEQKNDLTEVSEPELIALSPLGGRQGTTLQVVVKGRMLGEAFAAWFQCGDLHATIKKIEKMDPETLEKDPKAKTPATPVYQVSLEVEVSPGVAVGLHPLRLVTPRGVSNAMTFQVVSEPVVAETSAPHNAPAEAQVLQFPVVVNGRIGQKGELDFYAFEVTAGQELAFQLLSDFKMDVSYRAQADLALYELSGSWFDPERANPLSLDAPLLSWEPVSKFVRKDFGAKFVLFPAFSHRFSRKGRYLVSVGSFTGRGGPDYPYQLRIVSGGQPSAYRSTRWSSGEPAHPEAGDWLERDSSTLRQIGSFTRRLEDHRLQELESRAVRAQQESGVQLTRLNSLSSEPGSKNDGIGASSTPITRSATPEEFPTPLILRKEKEPNDRPDQALQITVPTLVEGSIDHPGDIDSFSFNVASGQRLAVEIETPKAAPPRFNPWLKILDSQGQELLTNIYKEYGGDGDDVNKTVERKTLYTFNQEGKYTLQIRDLTYRLGGADFAYRLLVRPQIPHIGNLDVSLGSREKGSQIIDTTDRINLVVGESRKFTVVCEKEEGFEGEIAISVENLPPGVTAFPSSPAEWTDMLLRGIQYRPLGVDVIDPANYRGKRQVITIALLAGPEAKPMPGPTLLRLSARPIVNGRPGDPILAGEFPFMLVKPAGALIQTKSQTQ